VDEMGGQRDDSTHTPRTSEGIRLVRGTYLQYGRYERAPCFCQRRQKSRAMSSPVVWVAACSTLYFQESLSPVFFSSLPSPLSPLPSRPNSGAPSAPLPRR
jgi:hypothetical protein